MTTDPRSDRFGISVAILGGLLVAAITVLVVFLISGNGDGGTTTAATGSTTSAPGTTGVVTTVGPSTSTAGPTTTAAPTTTEVTTTTEATTTTTTAPPFAGTLEDKTGPAQGTPAGRLTGIRSAPHDGYARVVFDFAPGGIPGYWIGYTGSNRLSAILYPMSWGNPYDDGIFDAGGEHAVAAGSVTAVHDGGMGGGSGEWVFDILVDGQKPFLVGTLEDPPRIYVDVGD